MSVKVYSVDQGSIAEKKGFKSGDIILKINGNEINDVLDYRFYINEKKLVIDIKRERSLKNKIRIRKDEDEDIGLNFETYLMDKQRHCKNKCMFCFIDQLPKGMRDSLYFKDDDSRLSFLFGNYITLTNLTQHDVDRIIKMHISPVNVSVHTMNPDLRVKMMANPFAGESLKYLKQFADAGIKINTQLVLCPGVNDGDELDYSLSELAKLYPAVQSIAAVPVGLTDHREGLCDIKPYNKSSANDVLSRISVFNSHFMWYNKEIIAYAADEFYLMAEKEIPDADSYGEFLQLENGVGMWALLKREFEDELENIESQSVNRTVSAVTGEAAYPLISSLAKQLEEKVEGLKINVHKIINKTFGDKITVAGLICGKDIAEQLSDKDLCDELLLPSVSLRHEGDIFLDDLSVEELSKQLGINIRVTPNDGCELLYSFLGE